MILIKIKHQEGEREYTSYHYKTALTEKQYNHAAQLDFNPTRRDGYPPYSLEEKIIKEIWEDEISEYDNINDAWWRDTSVVWIEDVRDLSKTRFETLVELGILYR